MTPFKYMCVGVLLIGVTLAEIANHQPCSEVAQDLCTVSQVRVVPCKNPRSCRLKKGSPASISFDFTPNFSASALKTGLYWASGGGDLPFSDLQDADGCQYTSCPVESGKTQELSYSLNLSKKLPSGTYDFKWKLRNADDDSQVCCFKTTIQLRP